MNENKRKFRIVHPIILQLPILTILVRFLLLIRSIIEYAKIFRKKNSPQIGILSISNINFQIISFRNIFHYSFETVTVRVKREDSNSRSNENSFH